MRDRIGWGRAFGHAAVAIGVPWAIVSVLAIALGVAQGEGIERGGLPLAVGPGIALVAIVIDAVATRRAGMHSRASAGARAVIACFAALAVGGIVASVAILASESPGGAMIGVIAIFFAALSFTVSGGPLWAVAGAIAAGRILGLPPAHVPWGVVLGWGVGSLAIVGVGIGISASGPASCEGRPLTPLNPISWGCGDSLIGNVSFAWGIALVAAGIALLIARREPKPEPRRTFLFE